jgi:hypothetical protein
MYFCDMCCKTTNFINIVERIPYAPTGTREVAPGGYFPAPEKYKDWALPNNGVELYYAHIKALAQFFGWHRNVMQETDQVTKVFMSNQEWETRQWVWGQLESTGYNSPERDKSIVDWMVQDPEVLTYTAPSFAPPTAIGFKDMCHDFISSTCPGAFPKELTQKKYLDTFNTEATDMSKYCNEMSFYLYAMREYFSLCHPNAQVDNAFYWKTASGETQCGLLDWGGVNFNNIPTCIGNGWMGAEPEVMEEHEKKLVELFCDEYEKASGFRFDADHMHLCLKLSQCVVFYGCCANIGMCLRIFKKDEWGKMKGRKDPRIDENFLLRCYFVQVHLWLKMWGLKNGPYKFFLKWVDRVKFPKQ